MPARNQPGDDVRLTWDYVSPAKDFILRRKILQREAARLTVGSAHEQANLYPDHVLSGFTKADEDGWLWVYYCKTRAAQEAYNYEFANVLNREWPELEQTFVFLRSVYVPSTTTPAGALAGAPPTFSGAYSWTFMGEEQVRTDPTTDGLFIMVKRVWRDRRTSLAGVAYDADTGALLPYSKTMVDAGTSGTAISATGAYSEVSPINQYHSLKTTKQASGLAGSAVLGVKTRTWQYRDNYPWPRVLNYIQINPIYTDPGNVYSAVTGYNWVPYWLTPAVNGPCLWTLTERWTSELPIIGGNANWTSQTGGSPELQTETPLLPNEIDFRGVDLNIQLPPCLHTSIGIQDTQTYGYYPATTPAVWPTKIIARVTLTPDQGGWLTRTFEVYSPTTTGQGSGLLLQLASSTATGFVLTWSVQTSGSLQVVKLDVSTDPTFTTGFLTGYQDKTVTPADNTAILATTTITGAVRGVTYYCRVKRGTGTIVTSNTCMAPTLAQGEIVLTSSGALADGGTLAFGDTVVGTSTNTKTITITNNGIKDLVGLVASFSGTHGTDWTAGSMPAKVTAGGGTATFVVICNPAASGSRTGTLSVLSSCIDNPSYDVTLTSTGVAPEINVKYSSTSYASGSSIDLVGTTSGGSYTDYTLTIENTGTGNLTVTAGVTNADGAWAIQTAPTTPVAGSGSTTMIVRFTPQVDGASVSTLTLTNNDSNEGTYILALQATGICLGTLQVTNPLGVVAASGGTYEFGTLYSPSGATIGVREKSFILTNSGVGVLSAITAAISGADAAEFSVTVSNASTLAVAATTTLTIQYDAALPDGAKSALLTITSSDPVTPSYTVSLTATSVSAATVPEIQVECPIGTVLVDGVSSLDFGTVLVTGGTAAKTIRIANVGCTSLTSIAATNVGGNTSDFTYGSVATPQAYNSTQDVVATFNPGDYGPRTTDMRIASNDADENPFNITVTGVGVPANALLTGQVAGVFIGQADGTAQLTTVNSSTTAYAFQAAVSSTGKLAISDETNNRVLIWNTVPTTSGVAADVVLGQANFTSSGAATTAVGLSAPRGLYWHGTNLWVVDKGNNRVLRYTNPTTSGQSASLVLGQANFTSSGAATTSTGMSDPTGVLIYAGKLLVADTTNNRVLVWSAVPSTNGAAASYALGQASGGANLTTATAATTAAGMSAPYSMAVTSTGNLLVVDKTNNRVLHFVGVPSAGGASASFALGQATGGSNLTTSAAATTAGGMSSPYAVAVSAAGQIAVADGSNNRVLIWYSTPTTVSDAHAVLGQSLFTTATAGTAAGTMTTPLGLGWSGNHLLVSATAMKRTMKFSPA